MRQQIPNTFGLKNYAKKVAIINSIKALQDIWQEAQTEGLPTMIIGEGSNSLFTTDYEGIIIVNRIMGIDLQESESEWILNIGAGERWHSIVEFTINNQIPGLENLALIPGCIGSAPIQNIGAYGVEFKQIAGAITLLKLSTGEIVTVTDGQYRYRDSIFKQKYAKDYAVINVELRLSKNWQPIISYGELKNLTCDNVTSKMVFEKVCEVRHHKLPDPAKLGNGGSFFKNPIVDKTKVEKLIVDFPDLPIYPQPNNQYKLSAGWLIEKSGLKGFQIGGAAVDQNHALILVNRDGATAEDVVNLARHVYQVVAEKFAVTLSPEIRFIGARGEIDADALLKKSC